MKTIARRAALPSARRFAGVPRAALVLLALGLAAACGKSGSSGKQGPPGTPATPPPTDSSLSKFEDAPGVNVVVTGVSGQTGPTGNFQAGDMLTVDYTVTKDDGQFWDMDEMATARIVMSGPSFNYQRVLLQQTDLASASTYLGDGMYRYTFATPIPDAYPAPYNDSPDFGPLDGELTGQDLLAGTYTVGLYMRWDYTVDGNGYEDVGNAVYDFLYGNAAGIEPHEVVTRANCNQCHVDLQAHGGLRKETKLCALCHTAGAEDRNPQTPGTSVDFRVMIHKIHNAAHLPSVLGVATDDDGNRVYDADPVPYVLAGFDTVDFSKVEFPIWPNLSNPMPRDFGYTGLSSAAKGLEDTIRGGVTSCDKCHGDPDGVGPLPAPQDGDLHFLQPGRAACASCHDDVDWTKPYAANEDSMTVADYGQACNTCHTSSGSPLSVIDGHRHPMVDPDFNPGLNFVISDVARVAAPDGGGAFQTGDRVGVTFTLENDDGTPVLPSALATTISVTMAGPNHNSNLLLNASFNKAAITGSPPYTVNLPELLWLEHVGPGSGTTGEEFLTSRKPHWHDLGSATSVRTVTGKSGGSALLTAAAPARQNFLDVDVEAGFAGGDYVVLDDANGAKEYMRIQSVDGKRLWFASLAQSDFPPSLRQGHGVGATVEEVTTSAKTTPADFAVDAAAGKLTEVGNALGIGEDILVTYTSDFELPAVYAGALNDSGDVDETWGDWSGKPVVAGTYRVALWSRLDLPLMLHGESQTYRAVSPGAAANVLVGTATTVEPYDLISSAGNCYECHNDIYFHGNGRRGVETCLMCHAVAGAEDFPPYRNIAALPTQGVTINFRNMLHKIHMGAELANASSYAVVGFGAAAHTYQHVEFPALPDGTKNCATCHGSDNDAWKEPGDRDHPTVQGLPVREWRTTCNSCHDSDQATAHIESQTAAGVESCAVCHGSGKEFGVEVMHKPR